MSSLRDLNVSVSIQDGATSSLNSINNKINQIIGGLQQLGGSFNSFTHNFSSINQQTSQFNSGLSTSVQTASSLNQQINSVQSGISSLNNNTGQSMQGVSQQTQNANNSMAALGSTIRRVAGIVGTVFAVDKIKDFAMSGIETAAGMQAMEAQFDQVFKGMENTAETNLNSIAQKTGILPERLKGSFIQMAAFAKTTGADTADAMSLAERATMAAADSAAFQDRSIEDVTENLRSLLKGNFENDSALGISVTETNRNAKAMEMFNKKFKDLNELQKQDALLTMVEDSHSATGAFEQASREMDGWENVTGNLKSSWEQLRGSMMDPFLETVTGSLQGLTTKLRGIDGEAIGMKMKKGFDLAKDTIMSLKNNTGDVSGLWQKAGFSKESSDSIADFGGLMRTSVVGGIEVAKVAFEGLKTTFQWAMEHKDGIISIATGLTAGFAAFKTISTGMKIFDTIKQIGGMASIFTKLTSPVGLAVLAIGGLVTMGVYLYKNWDTVMEKWDAVKEGFSSGWQQIKDDFGDATEKVGGFFTGLKDKVTGLWETIKENPMLLSVVGPIGAVIGAGMELYQNWDNIKGKAVELWSTTTEKFAGIKQSVSDFVEPAIGWFDTLSQKWDTFKSGLLNFEMPGWVTSIGDTIGSAANKVSGFVNGSHATGLASVPFDGYTAKLHKGESVLTASQSSGLRSMGVLSENSNGTPNLNLDRASDFGSNDLSTVSYGTPAVNGSRPSMSLENNFTFHITGGNAEEIIAKVKTVIPNLIRNTVSDMMDEDLQTI